MNSSQLFLSKNQAGNGLLGPDAEEEQAEESEKEQEDEE